MRLLRRDGWMLQKCKGESLPLYASYARGSCHSPTPPQRHSDRNAAQRIPASWMGLEEQTIMRYPIVIHKDEDSSFGVTVPDLPGCFSSGDTMDEAFDMAREAIVGHIETLLLDGQAIPEKRTLQEHQVSADFVDGVWGLVDVNVDALKLSGKSERVNITVPAHALTIIDEAATRAGESRSRFLVRAALSVIE